MLKLVNWLADNGKELLILIGCIALLAIWIAIHF